MKQHSTKILLAFTFLAVVISGIFLHANSDSRKDLAVPSAKANQEEQGVFTDDNLGTDLNQPDLTDQNPLPDTQIALDAFNQLFTSPINRHEERVTKKPFGLNILPGKSPIAGDRFTGIHVGVDFETFAEEADIPIAIYAICEGPLRIKTFANGYGGVAVQTCELDEQTISVIYGHLHLDSIQPSVQELLTQGQFIGYLGKGGSKQTDGVRKHLHLGIRSGVSSDIRGYIKDESELSNWYDVMSYLE